MKPITKPDETCGESLFVAEIHDRLKAKGKCRIFTYNIETIYSRLLTGWNTKVEYKQTEEPNIYDIKIVTETPLKDGEYYWIKRDEGDKWLLAIACLRRESRLYQTKEGFIFKTISGIDLAPKEVYQYRQGKIEKPKQ